VRMLLASKPAAARPATGAAALRAPVACTPVARAPRPGAGWATLAYSAQGLRPRAVRAADAPARAVAESLRGPSEPLPAGVRATMEAGFGADLGGVRVHADERAARAADAVDARAFSLGQHVVFGRGEYAPSAAGGRELLAHELAHTRQQRAAGGAAAAAGGALRVGRADAADEAHAHAAAHAVQAGRRAPALAPVGAHVARQPKPGAKDDAKPDEAAAKKAREEARKKQEQETARQEADKAFAEQEATVLRPATTVAPWPAKTQLVLDVGIASIPATVLSTDAETDTVDLELTLPARITLTLKDAPPPELSEVAAAAAAGKEPPTRKQLLGVKVSMGLPDGEQWELPLSIPDIKLEGNQVAGMQARTAEGRTELGADTGFPFGFVRVLSVTQTNLLPAGGRAGTRAGVDEAKDAEETKPVPTDKGRVASMQDLFPFSTGDIVKAESRRGLAGAVIAIIARLGGLSENATNALQAIDQSFLVATASARSLKLHTDQPLLLRLQGVREATKENEAPKPPQLEVSAYTFRRDENGNIQLGGQLFTKRITVKKDGDAYVIDTPAGKVRLARAGAEGRVSVSGFQVGAIGPSAAPAFPPPAPWNLLGAPYDPRVLRPDLDPGEDRLLPPLGLRYDQPWLFGTRPLASYVLKKLDLDVGATGLPRDTVVDAMTRYFGFQYGVRMESAIGTTLVAPTGGVYVAIPHDDLTFHGSLGLGLPTDLSQVFTDPGEAVDFGAYLDLAFGTPGGEYTAVVRTEAGTGSAPTAALLVFQVKK